MVRTVLRTAITFALAASVCTYAIPAKADTGEALATSVVQSANLAIKNSMNTTTVGQVPPVNQAPVSGKQNIGLPRGLTYQADVSAAYAYGDLGNARNNSKWLPGGFDGVIGYGFKNNVRVMADYYELQHYPQGFNSGTKPLYLQGVAAPIGAVDISTTHIDVTTKDKFTLFMVEKLFLIGNKLPIVITPTYVSRTSTIAASNGNSDIVAFETLPPGNGFPVVGVKTRTAQIKSIAFTLPFLKTPKMFGTATFAPSWLMHTNGLNQDNHPQLYQIYYLEYNPTDKTKIFFEPQGSRDYLPTDRYAQHLFAYFLGVAQKVGNNGFVQLVLNSGGPSNQGAYGVNALTCQATPCSANPVVPTVGGLKATQLQIQFGVGSSSVIPF